MAKAKKISASAFERAVKKNFEDVHIEEWCGLSVSISPVISLQEVFNLVSEVSTNCFSLDGQYTPEAMEAVLNCGIVERYTNISLPDDISSRYDLVVRSGIMDLVLQHIDAAQYNQIVTAVRDRIDYMCDSNVAAFTRSVNKIIDAVDGLKNNTEKLLGDFDPEDFRAIVRSIGDSTPDDLAVDKLNK